MNNVLLEIYRILNTGLDMETLSICVRFCEQGITPKPYRLLLRSCGKAPEH